MSTNAFAKLFRNGLEKNSSPANEYFVLSTESLRMSDSYESFIHESDITNHLTTEV